MLKYKGIRQVYLLKPRDINGKFLLKYKELS